ALRLSSRSASWKRLTAGRLDSSRVKAGAVSAGAAAAVSGASLPPQADRARVMASDSSRRGAVALKAVSGSVDGDGGPADTGVGALYACVRPPGGVVGHARRLRRPPGRDAEQAESGLDNDGGVAGCACISTVRRAR